MRNYREMQSGEARLCEKTEPAAFFQKNPDSALPCKLCAKSKQKMRRKSDNPKCGGGGRIRTIGF